MMPYPKIMLDIDSYKVVVFSMECILLSIIVVDCSLHKILWTTIFYYCLTQALIIFRLFGRHFGTIFLHAASSLAILCTLYYHYYKDFGSEDTEYYRDDNAIGYKLVLEPKSRIRKLSRRAEFISFWLTYPLALMVFASFAGMCCIISLSLHARKMFAAFHSTLGLCVVMIYFLVCVFYGHYFKTYDHTVTIKMFYNLSFLFILLSPKLINNTQILSKDYTESEEDQDEEEGEEEEIIVERI